MDDCKIWGINNNVFAVLFPKMKSHMEGSWGGWEYVPESRVCFESVQV